MITYAKLRSGAWGVRVSGAVPERGSLVVVQCRDGHKKEEHIGRVLWNRGGVALCSIAPRRTSTTSR